MSYSIGILVGSLRKDSFSKKIALAISKKLPEDFEGKLIDISRLALFNQDLEAEPPQEWLDFREEVKSSDGVLFVTPEYNRSIPAVLKNALDVASRPYGQGAWQGKPGAIASSSPGKIGGFGASQHLRQAAVCVGLEVMGSPEFYLGGVHEILDGNGDVSGAYATALLDGFVAAYAKWVRSLAPKA